MNFLLFFKQILYLMLVFISSNTVAQQILQDENLYALEEQTNQERKFHFSKPFKLCNSCGKFHSCSKPCPKLSSCSSKPCFKPSCSQPCYKPSCLQNCKQSSCSINSQTNCITTITEVPFAITSPGVYCLDDDFTLLDDCCSVAITIQANNVTLNLNGFTLSGGLHGIVIYDCTINAIVKNGSITNTQADAIVVSKGAKNIQLLDLQITNANQSTVCPGFAGIFFDGAINDPIRNNIIKNVSIANCLGSGLIMNFCSDSKVSNSSAQGITSTPLSDANGFYINNGMDITVDHCSTYSSFALHLNSVARGFFVENSINIQFFDCSSSLGMVSPIALSAFGFDIDSSECIVCDLCFSTSHLRNGEGFFSSNSIGSIFKQCVACENSDTGFTLLHDIGSSIINCLATRNSDAYFVSSSNNCVIGENKAVGNNFIGFELGSVMTTNRFYNNFSAQNPSCPTNYFNVMFPDGPVVGLGCAPLVGNNINGDSPPPTCTC